MYSSVFIGAVFPLLLAGGAEPADGRGARRCSARRGGVHWWQDQAQGSLGKALMNGLGNAVMALLVAVLLLVCPGGCAWVTTVGFYL